MKNEIPKKGQWGVAVLTHSRAQCPYRGCGPASPAPPLAQSAIGFLYFIVNSKKQSGSVKRLTLSVGIIFSAL